MKKFLMSTAALAVCIGLTACNSGGGGAAGVTGIQSITAPEVTQQTVAQTVPQTAAESAEKPVQTEKNVQTTAKTVQTEEPVQTTAEPDYWTEPDDEPDEPEVTLPDAIQDCEHSTMVTHMFYDGLPICGRSGCEAGFSGYDECNECYKRLLAESLVNQCDRTVLFGGAYYCDGRLHLMITDLGKCDELFGDFFDDLESVTIESCKYSRYDLMNVIYEIWTIDDTASCEIVEWENRVTVTVLSEEAADAVLEAAENAGCGSDAVLIEIEAG